MILPSPSWLTKVTLVSDKVDSVTASINVKETSTDVLVCSASPVRVDSALTLKALRNCSVPLLSSRNGATTTIHSPSSTYSANVPFSSDSRLIQSEPSEFQSWKIADIPLPFESVRVPETRYLLCNATE